MLKLPRPQRTIPITEPDRTPTSAFQQWWDQFCRTIEEAVTDLAAAVARLTTAEDDIDAAEGDIASLQAADTALDSRLDAIEADFLTQAEGDVRYAQLTGATFTGVVQATEFRVGGTKVVGAQQAAIANDASGAANQATVNAMLAALRAHGLIAP